MFLLYFIQINYIDPFLSSFIKVPPVNKVMDEP